MGCKGFIVIWELNGYVSDMDAFKYFLAIILIPWLLCNIAQRVWSVCVKHDFLF